MNLRDLQEMSQQLEELRKKLQTAESVAKLSAQWQSRAYKAENALEKALQDAAGWEASARGARQAADIEGLQAKLNLWGATLQRVAQAVDASMCPTCRRIQRLLHEGGFLK